MPRSLNLAITVVAIIGCYWALLFVAQRSILFPRPVLVRAPVLPIDAQQIWLQTPTGRVEAWYLPPTTRSAGPAPLLLFTHGNAEVIDFWPEAFAEPRGWGIGVLLLEYPGYGRSAGMPSETSITSAILAAYDWARTQPTVDSSRIVAYGRSLGGGAACALSRVRPVAGLILESSFTSVPAFAGRFAAPGFLVRDRFDNLVALKSYRGPILVLHGDHDEVIPVAHGHRLAAAAGTELHLLPCGHNDCARPWPQVHTFLSQLGMVTGS